MVDVTNEKNTLLDVLKFICAILIVGSHALPIFYNGSLNFYYGQWLFRFAVPLFIISSGFYFERMEQDRRKLYIKRILIIYIIGVLIYFPNILKSCGGFNQFSILSFLRMLFFGYYHLWYLVALFMALLVSYILNKFLPIEKHKKLYVLLCVVLLLIGIFFDEYYKIFNNKFFIKIVHILNLFGTTRNFIFMTIPLLTIGRFMYIERKKIFEVKPVFYLLFTLLFFALSAMELRLLEGLKIENITTDLTFFNFMPAVLLFILTFYYHPKCLEGKTTVFRKQADVIYIVHILVIEVLNIIFHLQYHLQFLIVVLISWILSFVIIKILDLIKKRKRKVVVSVIEK